MLPSLLLLLSLFPPVAAAPQAVQYEDATAGAGLTFTHALDLANNGNPMVAGGAVADFDRDGWPDLFLLGGGGRPDALFLNDGDGTFTDHAAAWGVAVSHHGSGVSAADYDGDGWVDLYVTSFGPAGSPPAAGHHRLYHNEHGTGFTEVAAAAGVATTGLGAPDGYSSAWGDYDLDGDLDLYVAGWELNNQGNHLFRNEGNGAFTDVSVAAGVKAAGVKGFVPGFLDMDGDLWPELILIGDAGTSAYFVNDGDGTFHRLVPGPPGLDGLNGMGLAIADLDGDGLPDFYASSIDWGTPNTGNGLWWNQGGHAYVEDAHGAGVAQGAWGWGVAALECDNDGLPDLVETNGWSSPGFDAEPDRLFLNLGGRSFQESAATAGVTHVGQGRTVLRLDADRDGLEDFVVLSNQEPLVYYHATTTTSNHWLRVTLSTAGRDDLAPDGFGARSEVQSGGRSLTRWLDGAPSYLGTHEPTLHFGLGGTTVVDELRVRWPDGSWTVLRDVAADQEVTVESGALPLAFSAEPRRGTTVEVVCTGARANELVLFLHSLQGVGAGPLHPNPVLGGLRPSLRPPVQVTGTATADATGAARLPVAVPATAPLLTLGVQAFALRGVNGADTVSSNAVEASIVP